jgi:hypothetical protein
MNVTEEPAVSIFKIHECLFYPEDRGRSFLGIVGTYPLIDPEDGSSRFIRNYTASHPRRP